MAKFEVKRNNIYYSENTTDADNVISFRAETNEPRPSRWFGFYDFGTNTFHIIPSGQDEMICLELESHEYESLTEFESRLRSVIYNYCDEVVNLMAVATDYACMEDMKWTNEQTLYLTFPTNRSIIVT